MFPCKSHCNDHELHNQNISLPNGGTEECFSLTKSVIEECEVVQQCQINGDGETLGIT